MVIEKEMIPNIIDLESHVKILNLFPLIDKVDDVLIEDIEVRDKKLTFCKHNTDIVIKTSDGRRLSAHANFMEEYNAQQRPKSLVGFKYKVRGGYLKVTSKLENRWMYFGYYPDDHLTVREMMPTLVCESDINRRNDDYLRFLLSDEEIDAVCSRVKDRAEFLQFADADKKAAKPKRKVKSPKKTIAKS